MTISIAMATYNGANYLKKQLESFAAQIRLPDELVVCDDLSNDATIEILEGFSHAAPFRVEIVVNEKNLGFTRNFEKALSMCNGDLIFISDQDDVWDKEKISLIDISKTEHPDVNVFINDATYTDEELIPYDVTVLQKVISVGASKNGHIAGACTMMTKEFRDFILPFPKNNCPQYDVYIHRWANLIESKLVIDTSLQSWRIHRNNTTSSNEMSQPELTSALNRYNRTKNMNSSSAYIKKANEFKEMDRIIRERENSLKLIVTTQQIKKIRLEINRIIDAHMNRSQLANSNWFNKKKIIVKMIRNKQYRYFKGFNSIVKDILS